MKRTLSIILAAVMMITVFASFTVFADEDISIEMRIDDSVMTVNGEQKLIDAEGTAPVIVNDRTLVPIRAIIEAMGGEVGWNEAVRTVTLNYDEDEIRLVIDSTAAYLNGKESKLDTAPTIINGRTMLPIRYIAESFGFDVNWTQETKTITIKKEIKNNIAEPAAAKTNADKSSAVVVYFSRAGEQYGVGTVERGNTAVIADMIAEETGADSFEILPKNDIYPVTYDALTEVAKKEQNDKARPEIASEINDFEQYDTVFLGYPIWWGDMPMIVYSFLERYDFEGKTVIPFCTHAGSGLSGTVDDIRKAIPNANVKDGLAVAGVDSQKNTNKVRTTVAKWVNDLGYEKTASEVKSVGTNDFDLDKATVKQKEKNTTDK